MPNIKLMESGLPVAPLKIGALESCRELGEKVNDYIVQFRKVQWTRTQIHHYIIITCVTII